LLASLDPDVAAGQDRDAEWIAKIERRARAAMAGSPGISWSEARSWIRGRISDPGRSGVGVEVTRPAVRSDPNLVPDIVLRA
jgi:hypothetical protein